LAVTGGKKQKVVLAVLVIFLAGYWAKGMLFAPDVKPPAKSDTVNLGALPSHDFPDVDLSQLDKLNVPVKVTRNIFDPVYKPPVVKPIDTPKPIEAVTVPTPNRPPPPPPPPPPSREEIEANKAQDEIRQFRFSGFVARKERLDILLTHSKAFVVAVPGEDIDLGADYAMYRFYVREVRPDSLVIADRAHKIDGKEVEVTIDADFEGKNIDVITNASAPYVGVGATGGGVHGASQSGSGSSPAQGPPSSGQGSRGPSPGGRRAPASPPRGVVVQEVPVIVGGSAAQPLGGSGGEDEESPQYEPEVPGGEEDGSGGRDSTEDNTGGTVVQPDPIGGHSF
jgi:hypothetical protein